MPHTEINVATWNILTAQPDDRNVAPQADRLGSFIDALDSAPPGKFHVISLCEVELGQSGEPNGLFVANELGLSVHGFASHAGKRDGVFVAADTGWSEPKATILDPEHAGRVALKTSLGGIAVAGGHWSHEASKNRWRVQQTNATLGMLAGKHGVIMGDFNCLRVQQPRQSMARAGYRSVLSSLGLPRPPITFPTQKYRSRTVRWYQQPLVGRGYSIDDVYVNDGSFEIVDGGRLEGEADHFGVWATIRRRQEVLQEAEALRAAQPDMGVASPAAMRSYF